MSKGKGRAWPIGIIIIYGGFVLGLLGYLVFSSFQTVDLISENYYQEELSYQDQIERMKRAEALGEPVILKLSDDEKWLNVTFHEHFHGKSVRGRIFLYRPSDATKDRRYPIQLTSELRQDINISTFVRGNWRVKIIWHDGETEFYSEDQIYIR